MTQVFVSAVNKRKSLECCDLKQYNKGRLKFTNIWSRVKNRREVALVVCFRLCQASGRYLQDMLEARQRHFLEDILALEKRMESAVSARFLRMRRGGETRLRDGIPGGFYLQQVEEGSSSRQWKVTCLCWGRRVGKSPRWRGRTIFRWWTTVSWMEADIWKGTECTTSAWRLSGFQNEHFCSPAFAVLCEDSVSSASAYFTSCFCFRLSLKVSFNIGKERGIIDFDSNVSLWAKENL